MCRTLHAVVVEEAGALLARRAAARRPVPFELAAWPLRRLSRSGRFLAELGDPAP
jgi:hypothetical protein